VNKNRLTFVVVSFTDGKRYIDYFTFIVTQTMTLQSHKIQMTQTMTLQSHKIQMIQTMTLQPHKIQMIQIMTLQ